MELREVRPKASSTVQFKIAMKLNAKELCIERPSKNRVRFERGSAFILWLIQFPRESSHYNVLLSENKLEGMYGFGAGRRLQSPVPLSITFATFKILIYSVIIYPNVLKLCSEPTNLIVSDLSCDGVHFKVSYILKTRSRQSLPKLRNG
jgi:hypothetical protein